MENKIKPIAFYLPQFYPTPENDKWWEPGFTEWTNVVRTKPLFRGHYQPRLPRDLGFYDLRVPETRERQAEMAKEAGIYGFCYWHYWFGNGRRALDRVFDEVVQSKKPDFPFCLCWVNMSWSTTTWNKVQNYEMYIEQTYPGVEDFRAHFYAMLPAFKDERYIKHNGRLLYGIYDPYAPEFDFELFSKTWQKLAQDNDLPEFHFFAFYRGSKWGDYNKLGQYDSVMLDPFWTSYFQYNDSRLLSYKFRFLQKLKKPYTISYKEYSRIALNEFEKYPQCIPCIMPDFDHSPRSGYKGRIVTGSTPELWQELCSKVVSHLDKTGNDIFFIKAWNEWGEGNYLEPDQKWGDQYLKAIKSVIKGR